MIDDLVNLQDFLVNDTEIQTFCTSNFGGSRCKVILGFDDEEPPNETLCPFIEVNGVVYDVKGKQDSGGKVMVNAVISNNNIDTSEADKRTYSGFVQATRLGELVVKRILDYQGFEGLIEKIELKNERGMPTPLHGVRLLLTVKEIFSYCEE